MGRSSHDKRKPKIAKLPSAAAQVRTDVDVAGIYNRAISWHLGAIDWEGPWGHQTISVCDIVGLLTSQIRSFESMSWSELRSKEHHSIPIEKLNKIARDRLVKIDQDDIEEIFSLRLQGKHRIYGIRDGSALKIIWYDIDHGDNDYCVCRSYLKNT